MAAPGDRSTDDHITLLINGKIRTLDTAGTVVEAVAIRGDRFVATGSSDELRDAFNARAEEIDLRGKTVLPGLIDAHTHLEGTALHLASFADCHAPPHADLAGILGALADHATADPDAERISSFMLAEKLRERRYPTLAEMDAAVPDRPALIRAGAHISIVNTAALKRLGIEDVYVPPPGGHVVRDAAGNPTGVLIELYWHIGLPPFTPGQTSEAIDAMAARR